MLSFTTLRALLSALGRQGLAAGRQGLAVARGALPTAADLASPSAFGNYVGRQGRAALAQPAVQGGLGGFLGSSLADRFDNTDQRQDETLLMLYAYLQAQEEMARRRGRMGAGF